MMHPNLSMLSKIASSSDCDLALVDIYYSLSDVTPLLSHVDEHHPTTKQFLYQSDESTMLLPVTAGQRLEFGGWFHEPSQEYRFMKFFAEHLNAGLTFGCSKKANVSFSG